MSRTRVAAHVADILSEPALIWSRPGFGFLRFESMKVVSAARAVETLLASGMIQPGTTVVDSSSGIYAVALALAAHKHGLKCHIVASSMVDPVTEIQLTALGATVDRVDSAGSLRLDQNIRVARVQEFLRGNPDAHWMRQYHDGVHYDGYRDLARDVDLPPGTRRVHLVGGVGSGASTYGLKAGFAENVDVALHGVQPFGSLTFDSTGVPDPEMIIAGIGSAIQFDNVRPDAYETVDWIGYQAAAIATHRMYQDVGLFSGLSTGVGYLVADKVVWPNADDGDVVMVISADTGHRYAQAVLDAVTTTRLNYGELRPKWVNSVTDLALPWSRASVATIREEISR